MKRYNAPKVKESKGIQILTTIWLVPFLAMIIALWLAFQYYAKIGPTIEISFKSNAGLIANQSQIKLRDVTIGMVTKISLSEDGTGVTVQARMNKEVAPYLNNKAKIWIVHPDVGSHGVSGLDTLLSGSYIELHGVKEEDTQHKFIGLEDPYIDSDAKGKYYRLSAPTSNDITEGSNVYYRKVKVGRVERVGISPDGKQVNFTIFVEERYTAFINSKSQFYTRSNFAMDFSQGKLDISIASLSQIIHGGISIYTPEQSIHPKEKSKITQREVYPLYKSLAEMKTKHLMTGADDKVYKFKFKDNINKLEISSPIEFNGFQVGYVIDIESHFDENNHSIQSDVFAIIHTKAFTNQHGQKKGEEILEELVKNGLKANLNTAVPMVGAQFIDLIFDKNISAVIVMNDDYPLFPTIEKKSSAGMMNEIEKLVVKLEKLPLENLLNSATKLIDDNNAPIKSLIMNLDNTIKDLNQFTSNKSLQELPENLSTTVKELKKTLTEFQNFTQGYNADSKFSAELSSTLKELSLAAESIERVSRKLEKKPNALLLGDD
ncbi:MCE family protein [bacterium]|nr:MCE family protein [bacterium]MBU1958451.1 MCE family protein [bacterium]